MFCKKISFIARESDLALVDNHIWPTEGTTRGVEWHKKGTAVGPESPLLKDFLQVRFAFCVNICLFDLASPLANCPREYVVSIQFDSIRFGAL